MLKNNIKMASRIFYTHRTRTMLSVLGIVIGIAAVIAIINAGESLKRFVLQQVEIFGSNYIEIEIKVPATKQSSHANMSGIAQGIEITTLKLKDAQKILSHPNISQVYGGIMGQEIISYQGINKTGLLWGVSAGFFDIDTGKVEYGRPFTEEEDKNLAQVVILGSKIKQDLFGDQPAVGRKISINQRKFKVIGVREKIGVNSFIDFDDVIIMPVRTLQKKVLGIKHINFIMAKVKDMTQVEATVSDIQNILRKQHSITDPHKDDFAVTSSTEAMRMLNVVFNALTILLVAVAGISLIVGGVGIMNIMYVSVLERTYEIGLRKAIGAENKDILQQFLAEAILINLLGGFLGIILGVVLSLVITFIAQSYHFNVITVISLKGVLVSVAFMFMVGIAFGFYPAKKAAQLDPVEALRYE